MATTSPSLGELLALYLSGLAGQERQEAQQELGRFIRWCGRDRKASDLTPPEMEEYAQWVGEWGSDASKRVNTVKAFLVFLRNKGFVSTSLAVHLKPPKAKKSAVGKAAQRLEEVMLSAEGRARLVEQLEVLKEERVRVIEEIQRAMADKDFRENAPLDAAKERQGQIESRIRELEEALERAVPVGTAGAAADRRVKIGCRVTLKELITGKSVSYLLVDSREADPTAGKISAASPVGRALLDRTVGAEIHVNAPRGTLRYLIEKVEA